MVHNQGDIDQHQGRGQHQQDLEIDIAEERSARLVWFVIVGDEDIDSCVPEDEHDVVYLDHQLKDVAEVELYRFYLEILGLFLVVNVALDQSVDKNRVDILRLQKDLVLLLLLLDLHSVLASSLLDVRPLLCIRVMLVLLNHHSLSFFGPLQ